MTNIKGPQKDIKEMFNLLSESNRYSIFNLLMTGTHCHCEIAETLNLSLSLLSHHLKILVDSGLILAVRDAYDARWIHYSINQALLNVYREQFNQLTNPERIKERPSICAPEFVLKTNHA